VWLIGNSDSDRAAIALAMEKHCEVWSHPRLDEDDLDYMLPRWQDVLAHCDFRQNSERLWVAVNLGCCGTKERTARINAAESLLGDSDHSRYICCSEGEGRTPEIDNDKNLVFKWPLYLSEPPFPALFVSLRLDRSASGSRIWLHRELCRAVEVAQ
jgi:hypothetical protein